VYRLRHLTRALEAGHLVRFCANFQRSARKAARTAKKVYLSAPALVSHRYAGPELPPEVLGRVLENDVFLRLSEHDPELSFWRLGRQEVDFRCHRAGQAFPVEVKLGRLRPVQARLMRALAGRWGAPFGLVVTLDELDLSDPALLKVPALLL